MNPALLTVLGPDLEGKSRPANLTLGLLTPPQSPGFLPASTQCKKVLMLISSKSSPLLCSCHPFDNCPQVWLGGETALAGHIPTATFNRFGQEGIQPLLGNLVWLSTGIIDRYSLGNVSVYYLQGLSEGTTRQGHPWQGSPWGYGYS